METSVTLAEASARFGIPVKRLRRWVRYHRFGKPTRDASGHYLVDPAKVQKYQELAAKVAELRDMLEDEEEAIAGEQ